MTMFNNKKSTLNYTNSTAEIEASGTETAIISVGATEQFGPYLPMHLDTLIAEKYAEAFGEVLHAYVLPTLPFNTSEEHANCKGTITVSPTVLTAMLEEIIVNLTKQGFTKFVLCNGHGGAYWESAFVKQINFKYPDLILITTHRHLAWEDALQHAGLQGLDEMHAGLLSVCTAMWLCPELVELKSMGSDIPRANKKFADYIYWDKLTEDGCWGKFEEETYTSVQLSEMGEKFWNFYIDKRSENLQSILDDAFRMKMTK